MRVRIRTLSRRCRLFTGLPISVASTSKPIVALTRSRSTSLAVSGSPTTNSASEACRGSVVPNQAMAARPFRCTTVSSRNAGPPGFFTPRSQSDTRFFETLR